MASVIHGKVKSSVRDFIVKHPIFNISDLIENTKLNPFSIRSEIGRMLKLEIISKSEEKIHVDPSHPGRPWIIYSLTEKGRAMLTHKGALGESENDFIIANYDIVKLAQMLQRFSLRYLLKHTNYSYEICEKVINKLVTEGWLDKKEEDNEVFYEIKGWPDSMVDLPENMKNIERMLETKDGITLESDYYLSAIDLLSNIKFYENEAADIANKALEYLDIAQDEEPSSGDYSPSLGLILFAKMQAYTYINNLFEANEFGRRALNIFIKCNMDDYALKVYDFLFRKIIEKGEVKEISVPSNEDKKIGIRIPNPVYYLITSEIRNDLLKQLFSMKMIFQSFKKIFVNISDLQEFMVSKLETQIGNLLELSESIRSISATSHDTIRKSQQLFDIQDLVNEAIGCSVQVSKQNNLSWILETPPELPPVNGNRTRIFNVFVDLLTSVCSEIPSGGNLLLKMGEENDEIQIMITSIKESRLQQSHYTDMVIVRRKLKTQHHQHNWFPSPRIKPITISSSELEQKLESYGNYLQPINYSNNFAPFNISQRKEGILVSLPKGKSEEE